MGQWVTGCDPWPTWPIQKWWPIRPMTHDPRPLTHFHLCSEWRADTLSSWQNCKAWRYLFSPPLFLPSHSFPYFHSPLLPFSLPNSFTSSPFPTPSRSIQLGDLGERCKLLQRGPGSRPWPPTHFCSIVSPGNTFGDSNFRLAYFLLQNK